MVYGILKLKNNPNISASGCLYSVVNEMSMLQVEASRLLLFFVAQYLNDDSPLPQLDL